jgi:hypothetical protein
MNSRAQAKSQPPQPSQPLLLPASPPLTWLRLPLLRLSRRRLPFRLPQKH